MKSYLVITGASSGIGKNTALTFQKQGWEIINISRRPCEIKDAVNLSIDLSTPGWENTHTTELTDTLKFAGKICLVHNACRYTQDTIDNINPESFRQTLEVNLIAPNILNKLLIPLMKPTSSIIYIGSTLSEKAVPNTASYCISKHAMIGMMRSTCQDLAGKKIHTCCICPGFTDTEMLRQHIGNNQEIIELIKQRNTAHRLIDPAEIASLIFYSANNPVINGSVLHAHLGQIEQ